MRQRYLSHLSYGRRVIGLAAGLIALAACGSGVDPDDPRPCDPKPGTNWVELGFQAVVTQPETCPIALDSVGQTLPLMGQVGFPTGQYSPLSGDVTLVDDVGILIKGISLSYLPDQIGGVDAWVADINNSYRAGLAGGSPGGKDTLKFDSAVINGPDHLDVLGRVDLTYTFVPRMAISGPASVSPQNIVEIDVSVQNGKLPLTYKWYHNNALVQTNVVNSYFNSYITFGLAEGTHTFDCVVTDADGDGNNKSLVVESSAGGGGPGF